MDYPGTKRWFSLGKGGRNSRKAVCSSYSQLLIHGLGELIIWSIMRDFADIIFSEAQELLLLLDTIN